jgi:hypothetical protein
MIVVLFIDIVFDELFSYQIRALKSLRALRTLRTFKSLMINDADIP